MCIYINADNLCKYVYTHILVSWNLLSLKCEFRVWGVPSVRENEGGAGAVLQEPGHMSHGQNSL